MLPSPTHREGQATPHRGLWELGRGTERCQLPWVKVTHNPASHAGSQQAIWHQTTSRSIRRTTDGPLAGDICHILNSNHLGRRCVLAVCFLGRVEEVSLSSERDSSLRKRWVGANSNPALWTPDYDLLPNVAIEHPGALLVHSACRFVYRLEHGSTPIAPDSRGRIRSPAFD